VIGRILCWFGLHAFAGPAYRVSDVAMRVTCARCQRRFAVNVEMQIITPWDADAEAFYTGRYARTRNLP
jgi:hypothetical protein